MTNDVSAGKIYAESPHFKAQFNYNTLPAEYSGGALYGLWDKDTASPNLVQVLNLGNGYYSPSRAGIGGLGTTKAYVNLSSQAITEASRRGVLVAGPDVTRIGSDVTVHFAYQVNDPAAVAHYRIDKTWLIRSDGSLRLTGRWTWLQPGEMVNDPNWNFAVSRDYDFSQVRWQTHEWGAPPCNGQGSDGFATANEWRSSGLGVGLGDPDPATVPSDPNMTRIDIGTKHVQEYVFDAPALKLHIGWGAGGYEQSGLFAIGYGSWFPTKGTAATSQITGELSSYNLLPDAYGHTARFGSWFSSDGSTARFVPLVGTEWTDVFEVSIEH